MVEHDGELIGVMATHGLESSGESASWRPDIARYEFDVHFLRDAWDHDVAAEAGAAMLMRWGEAFPDEPLLHRMRTADQPSAQLLDAWGLMEVDRFEENGVELRVDVWLPRGRHPGEVRRVLLPSGIPSPGRWARWRGDWFPYASRDRTSASARLSIDSTRSPGEGWRQYDLPADGWRRYCCEAPLEEIEAIELFGVVATWRGTEIFVNAVAPGGKAFGWAEPSTAAEVGELLEALDAAGHSGSSVEHRLVQVTVDAVELQGFRVSGHEDVFADRPGRADGTSSAVRPWSEDSPSQGVNYRSIPAPEREALARLVSCIAAAAPSGSERIEVVHGHMSSRVSTSMTASVSGEEQPIPADSTMMRCLADLKRAMYIPGRGTWIGVTAIIVPDGCTDIRFNLDNEPDLDGAVPGLYADELYRYPRAAEHIPPWWLADL